MKGLYYVIALLLSLPNLIAGIACVIIRHTFATRNPLRIIYDFLFQVVWGLPLAALLFLLLFVFGIISNTRPYAALFALILNITALTLVLARFGLPSDLDQLVFFVPVVLAVIGFGWIAWPGFVRRGGRQLTSES